MRDRDTKYTAVFDAVFQTEEAEVLLSTPRAPRMNAHCERVIDTVRREALDHSLILTEARATRILAEFTRRYHTHRPHRARHQRPPEATEPPRTTN
ncbi:integrase core domain-containing protein [Streptomyces sp. BH097]|uniref:integrase core domain-containing protein n=1 Tax=unclassified Streptomyces TaxID=2593676 RepID=UPI003BB6D446